MRTSLAMMPLSASTSSSPTKTSWVARSRVFVILPAVAVIMIMALFLRITASTSKTPVEFQSLYASHGQRDDVSIIKAGRVLQEDGDVGEPRINYETQLQLFTCNPSLVEEGNDAYLVDTARLSLALSRIFGLGQTDPNHIAVTIKTGPSDSEDMAYMCETDGMLQWYAKVDFDADDSALSGMTPAVMAAQANDYIAYSSNEFRALLSASINDEYASSSETVDLSAEDIIVRNVGWIVTFPSETMSVLKAETTRSSDDSTIEVAAYVDLWSLWMWLVLGLLLGCGMGPFCICLCRRRDKNATACDGRSNNQNSEKIRGPGWGTNEPDIEKDCRQEETRDYDGRDIGPKSYSLPNQGRHRGIVDEVYMQKKSKRPSSLPRQDGLSVRRMDLNHEDEGMARPRGNQSQYSFETRGRSRRGGFGDD